jgi:ABC-type Fe3+ transport system permease subunit
MKQWVVYTMSLAGLITTIAVTVLGIVDLWFVVIGGTGSSISNFLINAGFKSPMLVFALGYLGGHLCGYMTPVPNPASNPKDENKRTN